MDLVAESQRMQLGELMELLARDGAIVQALDVNGWRRLIEMLTHRIQEEGATLTPGGWEVCSAAVLRSLSGGVEAGAFNASEALTRRLNLTLAALAQAEPVDRVELLSPRHAIHLAVEEMPSDPEGVAVEARAWRSLPRARVLELRRLKNILTPALELARRYGDRRLEVWNEIYPTLP